MADRLELPPMVVNNRDPKQTAFTVTCDLIEGTSTGVSAYDRGLTCRALADPSIDAAAFHRPGHIFPLRARPGGVLSRRGHTEAAVDLCELAGCGSVGLIGEIMDHATGEMMRLPACAAFAVEFGLHLITVEALAQHCLSRKTAATPEEHEAAMLRLAQHVIAPALTAAPWETFHACSMRRRGVEESCEAIAMASEVADGVPGEDRALFTAVQKLILQPADEPWRSAAVFAYTCVPPTQEATVALLRDHGVTLLVHAGLVEPASSILDSLSSAGMELLGLPMASKARAMMGEQTAGWRCHRDTGLPLVVIKTAQSLDGKVACRDGTSQWITGSEAREAGHALRAWSHAIVIGSQTALADRPKLNVRLPRPEDAPVEVCGMAMPGWPPLPLRVIMDGRGRLTEAGHPTIDTSTGPTLICTTKEGMAKSGAAWKDLGVDVAVVEAGAEGAGVDSRRVLEELARRGVRHVMIEGGAQVAGDFLQTGLADRLQVNIGPCMLGGEATPWIDLPMARTISEASFWQIRGDTQQKGDDVRIEYDLRRPRGEARR